jgi:acyl-homoserine lactone acylase PvdQ
MWNPDKSLQQSYLRTKAQNQREWKTIMDMRANSSNNTTYADSDGNIAYYHGNFIPKRDTIFDFSKPVDGSDPATDWQGLHTLEEMIHILNPSNM